MDVLLHLEFLNPQVQRTPISWECPQPSVPQVGRLNQVQIGSTEGHSQTFASPPLHVLWPARIGPVPWGSLYLGTLWGEQEWQYFHQVPLVYPSSLQMLIAPCWLSHLQVATRICINTRFVLLFLQNGICFRKICSNYNQIEQGMAQDSIDTMG